MVVRSTKLSPHKWLSHVNRLGDDPVLARSRQLERNLVNLCDVFLLLMYERMNRPM